MSKYESPFNELQSSIDNIRGQLIQKSYHSPNVDGLEAELSDVSNLFSQQEANDIDDFNEHIAKKRRRRNS